MKLWKWIKKCPLLFLMLAGWIGLTVYTWSEGKMADAAGNDVIQNPVFTALLDQDADLIDSSQIDLDEWQTLVDGEDDIDGSMIDDVDGINSKNPDLPGGAGTSDGSQPGADGNGTDGSGQQGAGGNGTDGSGQPGAGGNGTDGSGRQGADGNSTDGSQPGADGNGTDGSGQQGADGNGQPAGTDVSDGVGEEAGVTRFKKYKKKRTDSPYYTDPGKKALTTEYTYQEVDKSYFDDAVFIGDSRTVGMQDYSGLDNAVFFAKTGLNVYKLLEDKFITDPSTGRDTTVAHMLKEKQYGKVYLMIGINELGTGNTGTFQKAYSRVLRKIRKWQPNAVIYIQGIIPVSKAKSKEDAIFNNVNINDKNVAIAQLADGKNIFYLDVSEKLTDKKGCLKADYTFDEVHMYAQYYELWTDYLTKHAVVRK